MFLLLATDSLTIPLTILSALASLDLLTNSALNIHLLGTTGREYLAMPIFEEILHHLPTLKSLAITGVGPSSGLIQGNAPYENLGCCLSCQAKA